jgi:hypothetical protein
MNVISNRPKKGSQRITKREKDLKKKLKLNKYTYKSGSKKPRQRRKGKKSRLQITKHRNVKKKNIDWG